MSNQRRRGKSVVFEMLPSFHTPEPDGGDELKPRRPTPAWRVKLSREAVQEIVMVIVGLALVVWLFFGGGDASGGLKELRWAGRPVVQTGSAIIVPAHAGSATSRDAVKKAPGDKHGDTTFIDKAPADKSGKSPVYQFIGSKSSGPRAVLVTVLDDTRYPRDYCDKIIENRVEYANEHGYGVLIRYVSDFSKFIEETANHQQSWTRVALSREAMETFPHAEWFWFLDQSAIIMKPQVDLLKQYTHPDQLEPKMLREKPILRGSDNIRTYKQNPASDVVLILIRDERGLTSSSYMYRNTVMAKSWLEVWMEPIYRNYHAFQNEVDALLHMMQWHNRYLMYSAVIPPRLLAASVFPPEGELNDELRYYDIDFVAMANCDYATEPCKRDFHKLWNSRQRVDKPQQAPQGKQPEGQNPAQAKAQQRAQAQAQAQAEAKAQQ